MNRNAIRTIGQIVVSGSALLSFALPNQTHAQFTGNNQTNVISGVITNWPTLNVGNQRSGDSLIISNAANVFSSYAYVGQYGSNNGVQITGSGSLWSNANNVYIGAPGSANRVTINDQGRMLNGNDCYIGYTGIYSNSVLVSGNGSLLSNRWDLFVGHGGAGNSLVVENGGKVINHHDASLGSGSGSSGSGSSNSVCVSGAGSLWENGGLDISGRANELIVTNGGTIVSSIGRIGASSGTSNSIVRVSGSGSVWRSRLSLSVGYYPGAANSLLIDAGGAVVSGLGIVGDNVGSSNNVVRVMGRGSVWSNYVETGFAGDDGFRPLCIGYSGPGNSLVINSGGAVFSGGAIGPGLGGSGPFIPGAVVGYNSSATSNNVLVAGADSVWRISGCNSDFALGGLEVGYSSAGNTLTISNGGSVIACEAYVGLNSGAEGNRINISDGNLSVTNASGGGILDIRRGTMTLNGGTVRADTLEIGSNPGQVVTAGLLVFNGGLLNCKTTSVNNAQQFVVGSGTKRATFHLLGGVHFFADGLRIRTNSFLTGCGTVDGSVLIDLGGAVHANCSNLVFKSGVTNNGTMVADGTVLEALGTFVNNGKLFLLNGATTNFPGVFLNNGQVLNGDVRLTIARDASGGFALRYGGAADVTYRLQRTATVAGTWTNLATGTAPASGLIEFHEITLPSGQAFYRVAQP